MAVPIETKKKGRGRAGTAALIITIIILLLAAAAGARAFLIYKEYQDADREYLGLAARHTRIDIDAAGGWTHAEPGAPAEGEVPGEPEDPRVTGKAGVDFPDLGIDHQALYGVNPDYMGWIWIDDEVSDIHISYPFLQGENNDTYLRKTMEGEKSTAGSIFADENTPADFSEHHTILYGHNMVDGSMFSDLKRYRGTSEEAQERYYYIFLRDGSVLKCRLFSTHVVPKTSTVFQVHMSDLLYGEFFPRVMGESEEDWGCGGLVPDSVPEKTVTLSTCHGQAGTSRRMVVHAYVDTWFVDPDAIVADTDQTGQAPGGEEAEDAEDAGQEN